MGQNRFNVFKYILWVPPIIYIYFIIYFILYILCLYFFKSGIGSILKVTSKYCNFTKIEVPKPEIEPCF